MRSLGVELRAQEINLVHLKLDYSDKNKPWIQEEDGQGEVEERKGKGESNINMFWL